MVSRSDGTVESDSSGDDNVTDGAGRQLTTGIMNSNLHGTGGFSPTETKGDLIISYILSKNKS